VSTPHRRGSRRARRAVSRPLVRRSLSRSVHRKWYPAPWSTSKQDSPRTRLTRSDGFEIRAGVRTRPRPSDAFAARETGRLRGGGGRPAYVEWTLDCAPSGGRRGGKCLVEIDHLRARGFSVKLAPQVVALTCWAHVILLHRQHDGGLPHGGCIANHDLRAANTPRRETVASTNAVYGADKGVCQGSRRQGQRAMKTLWILVAQGQETPRKEGPEKASCGAAGMYLYSGWTEEGARHVPGGHVVLTLASRAQDSLWIPSS